MRQLILPAVTLAALAAAAASLPAQAETRSFNLSNFDKVSAAAGVDVILKQGPYAVSVEEPDGKFDRLDLEVRGSTLVASRNSHSRARSTTALHHHRVGPRIQRAQRFVRLACRGRQPAS